MRGRKPTSPSSTDDGHRLAPPADMEPEEARLWSEIIESPAGIYLTGSDSPSLAQYVRAVLLERRMTAEARDCPLVVTSARGVPMTHPLIAELRQLRGLTARLASALGLNPTSRRGCTPPPKPKSEDPDAVYLRKLLEE
jgi:phage terminase small subunit